LPGTWPNANPAGETSPGDLRLEPSRKRKGRPWAGSRHPVNGRYCETGNRYFPPSFGRLPGRLESAARLVRSQRERTESPDSGAGGPSARGRLTGAARRRATVASNAGRDPAHHPGVSLPWRRPPQGVGAVAGARGAHLDAARAAADARQPFAGTATEAAAGWGQAP